jgi:hypothetical protein
MLGLFVTLGITILTLIVILLWFVPHLIQQQASLERQVQQSSDEAEHLRGILFDIIQEQETVLKGQRGRYGPGNGPAERPENRTPAAPPPFFETPLREGDVAGQAAAYFSSDPADLRLLEKRIRDLQEQMETHMGIARKNAQQDNESWAYLLSLLSAILERVQDAPTESSETLLHLPVSNPHERHCH